MHRPRSQVAEELSACIRCNECLAACPALPGPITIKTLNQQTLEGPISGDVAHFAQACFQCGACVPVCPVGLHRDAMMLWLKMRLLSGNASASNTSPRVPAIPVAAASSARHRQFVDVPGMAHTGTPAPGRSGESWRGRR